MRTILTSVFMFSIGFGIGLLLSGGHVQRVSEVGMPENIFQSPTEYICSDGSIWWVFGAPGLMAPDGVTCKRTGIWND